jgi:hypothetical protein
MLSLIIRSSFLSSSPIVIRIINLSNLRYQAHLELVPHPRVAQVTHNITPPENAPSASGNVAAQACGEAGPNGGAQPNDQQILDPQMVELIALQAHFAQLKAA